ncbi:fatty acyl-CoA reductase wat-like [Planococcus citri]|uniref:fatty acyl-CoA reductase wat-like n=1 Tax=Planococcus citri TaxID=170843 RepID=UPI0031F89D6B
MTDVQNFYAGKTILITGVTGYLGQMLLWKLLCSCPDIRCIYVLIREKSGKLMHERLKNMFDDPIFDQVKELHSDFETKVKPMKGDTSESDLDISTSDRDIIEREVEIVFHLAATIRFNSPLRKSTYLNIRSLNVLLDIAKNMRHLKVFVHVSTAYTPMVKTKHIEEKFYDPPFQAEKFISLIEHLDDEMLDEMTPKFLKTYPNTYVFTKLISEDLCREKGSELPLCIFRPGIITNCFKEPAPGWINNSYGIIKFLWGHAVGILKVANAHPNNRTSLIPGDYTTNALILSAYHTCKSWENRSAEGLMSNPLIINYTSCSGSTKFELTWRKVLDDFSKVAEKYPFPNMISLPRTRLISNSMLCRFVTVFLHQIPAVVLDTILVILGKNPRFIKLYKITHEYLDMVTPFTQQDWTMDIHNINEINAGLSETDKKIFYCDLDDINIDEYFEVLGRGIRLYCAKETEGTVLKAKKRKMMLLILHYVVVALIILILMYLLMICFNYFRIF